MTKQKTPHTQTQQNMKPEQTDSEPDQNAQNTDDQNYAETPGGPVQGVTSHSAVEESERQERVVKDRPDARAGLNRSK